MSGGESNRHPRPGQTAGVTLLRLQWELRMALIENLKQTQSALNEATTDYEALVSLAGFLARLANDSLITDPEAAQLLRDIAIESVRANHNKPVSVPELAQEVVSQAIGELLAKLPEDYIAGHELGYNVTTKTYHLVLLPTHTLLFKEQKGSQAIECIRRYVAERERQPGLPVGVVDGMYDEKARPQSTV